VADHKTAFFPEKTGAHELIDYHAAVCGSLCLVPVDAALAKLAADYQHMVADGLLLNDAESFDALLDQCRVIQEMANAA
jgi:hypothetical protein